MQVSQLYFNEDRLRVFSSPMIALGSSCPSQSVASHFTSFLLGNWEYIWAFLLHYFAPLDLPSADWIDTVVRIIKRKERLRLCLVIHTIT